MPLNFKSALAFSLIKGAERMVVDGIDLCRQCDSECHSQLEKCQRATESVVMAGIVVQ